MIIESSRMLASHSMIASSCHHVFEGKDNEAITILQGSDFDVKAMVGLARAFNSKYATRHIKINSYEAITDDQAKAFVDMYCHEFGASSKEAVIVRHDKPRADHKAYNHHYHIYLPEVMEDQEYKIMDSKFSKIREEKLARLAEIKFNHHPVVGKFNRSVVKQLRKEGLTNEADIVQANTPNDQPDATYTKKSYQMAKRQGISLNVIRDDMKALKKACGSFSQMVDRLLFINLEIQEGKKENTYILVTKDNKRFVGSANRFFGMKKNEFNEAYQSHLLGKDTQLASMKDMFNLSVKQSDKLTLSSTKESKAVPTKANISNVGLKSFEQGNVSRNSNATSYGLVSAHSERAVLLPGMSEEQRQLIIEFNKVMALKDELLRMTLESQKKLAELLEELTRIFDEVYRNLPRVDGFSDFLNSRRMDHRFIEKRLSYDFVDKKFHKKLDPLREDYLSKKKKIFSFGKAKALDEFNQKLVSLRITKDDNLDIIQSESDYNVCLGRKAHKVVRIRQKKYQNWLNNPKVKEYFDSENNFNDVKRYLRKATSSQNDHLQILQSLRDGGIDEALKKLNTIKKAKSIEIANTHTVNHTPNLENNFGFNNSKFI